jgi:two-component system, OmpR family, KDP operon response regulator KdpE
LTAPALQVLLIEDEPQMRRFLRGSLATHSADGREFKLVEASTGTEGLATAAAHPPDVILLDLGLPDIDGIEVTRRLREWTKAPIIVLSARGQDQDKVAALDAGADDYLTKPFSLPELLARIRVAVRHASAAQGKEESKFVIGELMIDLASRVVTLGGEGVRLTPIEYKLLSTLVRNGGRVMTYQQLLKEVWGLRYASQKQYLHVYVGHLRSKLERDPARPRFLLTEPGVGYRFKVD